MRLIFTFVILLFSLSTSSQIEVSYSVNFITTNKAANNNALNKSQMKLFEQSINVLNTSTGLLQICDDQSYFKISSNIIHDLDNFVIAKAFINSNVWYSLKNESGSIDWNRKRIVMSDYEKNNWKIDNKEKIIAGYSCLKATKRLEYESFPNLDRDLEVWFTPEIPVNTGFRDATGLPGLVIYYNDQQWEFIATKVSNKDDCNITLPITEKISFTEANKEASKRLKDKRSRSRNNN